MTDPQRRHTLLHTVLIGTISFWSAFIVVLELPTIRAFMSPEVTHLSNTQHAEASAAVTDETEILVVDPTTSTDEEAVPTFEPITLTVEPVLFEYIEIYDSCGVHFDGECVRARSGPGTEYPAVARLRNHMILRVDGKIESNGREWYKIAFAEHLRFPERLTSDWYVAADYAKALLDEGEKNLDENEPRASSTKEIRVNRSEQKLYAYDEGELVMEFSISTGLALTPTHPGTFTIFRKTPSRYMQGPLPGLTDTYDLPGVPWNLYFTKDGAVIHGAYWHDSFGSPYSHGCVNLSPRNAQRLYHWADLGMNVVVE